MYCNEGKHRVTTAALGIAAASLLVLSPVSHGEGYRYRSSDAWSFGVMGDTQWTLGRPGRTGYEDESNPEFVSESIASQVRDRFINHHDVKFVVQLGDLTNWNGDAAYDVVAAGAQELFDAGIGYYPLRGNHETYGYIYRNNMDFGMSYFREVFPQTQGLGPNLFGATNFSSPTELAPYDWTNQWTTYAFAPNDILRGLSYSFDFGPPGGNARFVIVDSEDAACESYTNSSGAQATRCWQYHPGQQQTWINARLNKDARGTSHAFVLSHRSLIGTNHADTVFGSSASSKTPMQNAHYGSMYNNGVRYVLTAHDHMYNRSIIRSPSLEYPLTQVIHMAASSKFYEPAALNAARTTREIELSQELLNVGYYVYTIDGPRVTVELYSDSTGGLQSDYCYPYGIEGAGDCGVYNPDAANRPEEFGTWISPNFNFVKKETFGYSLNGKEFLIGQGQSYAAVSDSHEYTAMRLLDGSNASTAVDGNGRPLVKAVNTGWASPGWDSRVLSLILSLWGMTEHGHRASDQYVLELSYIEPRTKGKGKKKGNAGIRLATVDAQGNWINAVEANVGPESPTGKTFIKGPWQPGYPLGTYGIDTTNHVVWAVINYDADFAAVRFD